ncbi:MAG: OmpA family protein [Magnetococcales bacterium]|nr:OmpA family protein [Magnetococcales bacterium]
MNSISKWWMLLLLPLLIMVVSTVQAGDCSRAQTLYLQAEELEGASQSERLLRQAVKLCPSHAESLNNLALTREEQGDYKEAATLYQRAIKAKPRFANPYAGLGDALAARNRPREAADAYQAFIQMVSNGSAPELRPHLAEYRSRLQKQLLKARRNGDVDASEITRSLLTAGLSGGSAKGGLRTRGVRVGKRAKPKIDLKILFATGSDAIDPASRSQLKQVAKALNSPRLKRTKIAIEGHTDSVGDRSFNRDLSSRRAASVRRALVNMGIDAGRLKPRGLGESQPISSNNTEQGRALNRRVTLVNAGGN